MEEQIGDQQRERCQLIRLIAGHNNDVECLMIIKLIDDNDDYDG